VGSEDGKDDGCEIGAADGCTLGCEDGSIGNVSLERISFTKLDWFTKESLSLALYLNTSGEAD